MARVCRGRSQIRRDPASVTWRGDAFSGDSHLRCRAPTLVSSGSYAHGVGAVLGTRHATSILGKAKQPVRSLAVFQTTVEQRARPAGVIIGYAAQKRDVRQTTRDLF
jgi:hypothetical protein